MRLLLRGALIIAGGATIVSVIAYWPIIRQVLL
jgi:hypothetical protein